MNKDLELKFNLKDWLFILGKIDLSDTNPEDKRYGGFLEHEKPGVIARNEENKIFREFLGGLKKKWDDNREIIKASYGKEFPFPELIPIPETKNNFIKPAVFRIVEDPKNSELYYKLLEVNNKPNYQQLVWRMSSDHKRDGVCVYLNFSKNEDAVLHAFKNAIMLSPPAHVQAEFEYFAEQWADLDSIDSKAETEEKKNEILSEFHKSMRQTDMFGNGHTCSIIYQLWVISPVIHRAFIAVTEYVRDDWHPHPWPKEFTKKNDGETA